MLLKKRNDLIFEETISLCNASIILTSRTVSLMRHRFDRTANAVHVVIWTTEQEYDDLDGILGLLNFGWLAELCSYN